MTGETKVGLVVGMGFIICFAVILSHNGQGLPSDGAAMLRDVRTTSAESWDPAPDGRLQDRPALETANYYPNRRGAGDAISQERGGRPDLRDSFSYAPSSPPSPAENHRSESLRVADGPARDSGPEVSERWSLPQIDRAAVGLAGPEVVTLSAPAVAGNAAWEKAGDAAGVAPEWRTYLVQPNDNLSAIAYRHYKTRSRSAIDALFQANKDVLETPAKILAGQELKIPPFSNEEFEPTGHVRGQSQSTDRISTLITSVAGASPKRDGSTIGTAGRADPVPPPRIETYRQPVPAAPDRVIEASRSAANPAPSRGDQGGKSKSGGASKDGRPSTTVKWRWYEIKSNDRISKIAADQLGDARRWKEIHEMNKDLFPNPDQIRPGERIRLPAE